MIIVPSVVRTMRAPTLSAFLWLLSQLIGSSKASTYQNATSDLRIILSNASWSNETIISYPGSDEFLNATERRVATYLPTYAVAVTPANEEDVATAVKLAVQHNIRFLATGGRHGFGLGYGRLQEGLAIDLSLFKGFTADAASATVTIGGAATVADFHDQLYDAGLMLPSGSCSCPGYLGLGVGGGIGRYMGTLGMVTDRIVSARVVTAAGDILTVSADEHTDLFWALRGAGANFGIVTSATFQAARAVDHNDGFALTIDMYFMPNSTARYFQHLEAVADSLPGNVAGIHITQYNSASGQGELAINWVWFGPEAEGRAFVAQFLALGPTTVENYVYVPWRQVISTVFNGLGETALCVKNEYASTYASNLKAFDAVTYQETFEALAAYYVDHPHGRGTNTNLEIFPKGGGRAGRGL